TFLRAEPLAADPFERAFFVAIITGKIELTDLERGERLPALERRFRRATRHIGVDGRAVGEEAQIDRERDILIALHQPDLTRRRLRMPGDELLNAKHLVETRLPTGHRRCPGLERRLGFLMAGRARRSRGAAGGPQ